MFEEASKAQGLENFVDGLIGFLTFGYAGFTAFGEEGWLSHLWESWGGPATPETAAAAIGDMPT